MRILSILLIKEKKEEIWRSPVTKTPTPTEQSKKATWQHKNATKNFDYTTIADRLRTVSWNNSSHPTGVVKPGLRALNLPTHRKSCVINRTWHDRTIVNNTDYFEDGYMLKLIKNQMKHFYTIRLVWVYYTIPYGFSMFLTPFEHHFSTF